MRTWRSGQRKRATCSSPSIHADYDEYVEGSSREDGVRSCLASRGITLPDGDPRDPRSLDTVAGLGNRKTELLLDLLHRKGVKVYEGSVRYLHAVRDAGLRRAVVSASKERPGGPGRRGHRRPVRRQGHGVVAEREGLKGKPEPDMFLAAAEKLGVLPSRAAAFEDALAGVAAGRSAAGG